MDKKTEEMLKQIRGTKGKETVSFSTRAETNNGPDNDKKIILRIMLDEWSPWYGPRTFKWREKISINCFDESLKEYKNGERVIKSYLDHDQSIDGLLSSTQREGVTLIKKDNEIIMTIPVDSADEKINKVYEQIRLGEIKSNSFIFRPEETETKEIAPSNDEEIPKFEDTIIKGELISIDPVYAGFYPNNLMEARGIKNVESNKPQLTVKNVKLKDVHRKNNHKGEFEMKEFITKMLVERKFITSAEAKEIKDDVLFAKYEEMKRNELNEAIKALKDEKEQERLTEQVEEAIAKTKADFESNTETRNKLKELEAKIAKENKKPVDSKELRKTLLSGKYTSSKDGKIKIKEELRESIKELQKSQVNKLSESEKNLYGRDISGSDAEHGSQIIPVLTDSEMISEEDHVIPELEGARRIPFAGENTTKVPISIIAPGSPKRKTQDEESDNVNTNAVSAVLAPLLYSEHFTWNPRMQVHQDTVSVDTRMLINRHKDGWRDEFATSLLVHKDATFEDLKGSDKNNSQYTGGITKDAITETAAASTLTLEDIDGILDKYKAKYGAVPKTLRMYINSKTLGVIRSLVRAANNDVWAGILDEKNSTYKGVKYVLNDSFTQNVENGEIPIIFYSTTGMRTYGGITVIRDSNEAEFKARKILRQVNTYGEVKLFDPFYSTKALQIKAA